MSAINSTNLDHHWKNTEQSEKKWWVRRHKEIFHEPSNPRSTSAAISVTKYRKLSNVAFIIAIITFILGMVITCMGIWILLDTSLNLYSIRILIQGESDVGTVLLTYANPVVWGLITLLPLVLSILILKTSSVKQFALYSLILTIFSAIIFVIQVICAAIPLSGIDSVSVSLNATTTSSFSKYYEGAPQTTTNEISLQWDNFMVREVCCGVSGSKDFISSDAAFKAEKWSTATHSYEISNGTIYTVLVRPMSCCKLSSDFRQNIDFSAMQSALQSELCPIDLADSTAKGVDEGCLSVIKFEMKIYTMGINSGLFILALFHLIQFLLTLITYLKVRQDSKVMPMSTHNRGPIVRLNEEHRLERTQPSTQIDPYRMQYTVKNVEPNVTSRAVL